MRHNILPKNIMSKELVEYFISNLNEQGFETHWSSDIFTALCLCVWRRSDLSKEMQHWIYDRINTFPQFYRNFDCDTLIQAAADIFFCNIKIYTKNFQDHTYRPR